MPHLSRLIVVVCLTVLVATAPLFAQEREESASGIEIGPLFGLSHTPDETNEDLTVIGVPGSILAGHSGNPALYVFWFPSEALSIGPEFSLSRISNGFVINTLYLGSRGAFSLRANTMSGAYVLSGALWVVNNEARTATDFSVGAGVGYWWHLGPVFVLCTEGGYRRWFDAEDNVFSLLLGLGTRHRTRETRSA